MAPRSKQAKTSPRALPALRWLGPLTVLLGLLPTAFTAWQALTVGAADAGGRPGRAQQKILAKIPKDPSVLINVTYRDMPSSPDILNLGKRSTKALERCLSDNVDVNVRSLCAVVLEALGDRRALPTLQAALEDWEVDVRYRVVRALGAIPDKSSVDPLLKLFARKDEEIYVRSAILDSLGSISDQRVVRMLRGLLRKKPDEDNGEDFRAQAFNALWRNRHLMGQPTLVGDCLDALRSDNDSLVLAATLAAAELRSPRLVNALIPLMEHSWPEVRNKAVYALGRIGDKKATKALLARLPKVRESRMLNNIAFALERLDKQAFYGSIKEVIEHKQAIIRLNAAFVLGDVKHAEGLPMLQHALQDASDFVRTSAIVAVGKLGTNAAQTKAAIAALEPFVSHPNLSVRQEAIYAIHALTQGGRRDLIHDELYQLDRRKHSGIVERAALELGKAGDPRVHDYLVTCLLRGACTQRTVGPYLQKHGRAGAKGRVLLAWARRDTGLSNLVAQLQPPGTLPVAVSALRDDWAYPRSDMTHTSLRILGSVGDSSVSSLLERRANTRHTWARVEGRVALARLGHGDAPNLLLAEMDNLPAAWFPRFAKAMSRVHEPAVRSKLDPGLEQKQADQDVNIALAAAAIRLSWDPDKAVFRFLDALASPSSHERDLAERYLSRNKDDKVTWLLRRALAREGRVHTRDRLRALLDERG